MDKALLADADPRERIRAILAHLDRFDNTVQYGWFLEIARTFLGFQGDRLTAADADALWDAAERIFAQPDWEEQVLQRSNLEKVFLTNDFDDPLTGFDTTRYIPCLRTDDLVFHLDKPQVRERLARATGEEGRTRPGCGGPSASCSSISRPRGEGVRHFAAAGLHANGCLFGRLLDAGGAVPRVRPALRPDDRRQPPRLPRRRLPGPGPFRSAHLADPVRRAVQRLPRSDVLRLGAVQRPEPGAGQL